MKNNKYLFVAIIMILSLVFVALGCSRKEGKSAAAVSENVRAIRDGNGAVLPVPINAVEQSGDQERFDSFVWAADKLKAQYDSVVVLDARSESEYNKGHLPGAVRASWQEWSDMTNAQDSGGWGVILPNDKLSEIFGNLGIDGIKPVIIYTDTAAGWGEEGRQLWTFRVFGLNNTYILNGGIKAWEAAGGEITKVPAKITPVKGPAPNPNLALFASTQDVVNELGSVNILDTREDAEYAGTKIYGEASKGRIPGAKHIWFKDFYNADGYFLSPAQIRARMYAIGYDQDTPVITYCTGGIRSGLAAIILIASGYEDVRNYNASFSAWAGTKQNIDSEVYTSLPAELTSASTREIRKGQSKNIMFPPPYENLVTRTEDEANFNHLIWSPEKLEENYNKVVIIDARSKGDYDSEHLPNAVQLHWNELITKEYNGVPPDADIAKVLADRGIDATKTIVVYNNPLTGMAEETRLYWLLQYLGITDSYILNGGFDNWKAAGHKTTKDKTEIAKLDPVAGFNRNENLIISTENIASRLNSQSNEIKIFDARSDEEYATSRIPGAKFVWFRDFYHPDGTYLTPAETRARVAATGFDENDEIAIYCRGGIRSCVPFVTLQTAGYKNVKNYNSSFSSWVAAKEPLDDKKLTSIPAYN